MNYLLVRCGIIGLYYVIGKKNTQYNPKQNIDCKLIEHQDKLTELNLELFIKKMLFKENDIKQSSSNPEELFSEKVARVIKDRKEQDKEAREKYGIK